MNYYAGSFLLLPSSAAAWQKKTSGFPTAKFYTGESNFDEVSGMNECGNTTAESYTSPFPCNNIMLGSLL